MQEIIIGTAKKCCPVCRLLADIISREHPALKLRLPGAHERYYPWQAPTWLSQDIVSEMEKELAHIIGTKLLKEQKPVPTCSSSSEDSLSEGFIRPVNLAGVWEWVLDPDQISL
jgi:hypothetical protein